MRFFDLCKCAVVRWRRTHREKNGSEIFVTYEMIYRGYASISGASATSANFLRKTLSSAFENIVGLIGYLVRHIYAIGSFRR